MPWYLFLHLAIPNNCIIDCQVDAGSFISQCPLFGHFGHFKLFAFINIVVNTFIVQFLFEPAVTFIIPRNGIAGSESYKI